MNIGAKLLTLTVAAGFCATTAQGALVGFQAEDFTSVTAPGVSTLTSVVDADGVVYTPVFGSAIYSLGDTGNEPTLTYTVNLDAGEYDLYARVWVPTTGDLTETANTANQSRFSNDSFNLATELGDSPAAFNTINGVGNVAEREWAWINLVDDGSGVTGELGTAYTVAAAGPQTLVIRLRENGLLIDAFAFGTASETYTDAELNGIVPEPASLALLGLGGLLPARRGRTA